MINIKLNAMKGLFFDRQAVMDAADRATLRVLSKFGAFVRQRSKSSIRSRKAASKPGQPPSSHTGLLKRFIFFGYDRSKRSVVIGPIRLNNKSGEAPPSLEYSGACTVRTARRGKKIAKTVQIAARPYMNPAFQSEISKLPDLWANSIK